LDQDHENTRINIRKSAAGGYTMPIAFAATSKPWRQIEKNRKMNPIKNHRIAY